MTATKKVTFVMTDGELRQAISEWVAKHTRFKLTSFNGIIITGQKPLAAGMKEGMLACGTTAFPNFHIEAEELITV